MSLPHLNTQTTIKIGMYIKWYQNLSLHLFWMNWVGMCTYKYKRKKTTYFIYFKQIYALYDIRVVNKMKSAHASIFWFYGWVFGGETYSQNCAACIHAVEAMWTCKKQRVWYTSQRANVKVIRIRPTNSIHSRLS